MSDIIAAIRKELILRGNERLRLSQKRFFREDVILHGLGSGEVNKLAGEFYRQVSGSKKAAVFELCEKLWQSGYIEEGFIACNWSYRVRKQFTEEDFSVFERWVGKYITNWATCDTFCNHTVGTLVEMYPGCVNGLKKWVLSNNRWMRRASAVSLIVPARKGLFAGDIFEIAELLLRDKDDMVQKGYGWMLKSASQTHLNEVYGFVTAHKAAMPRTAYRYAIEKMPPAMRNEAMKK